MSSSSEAQIKSEIARLTASINLHKSGAAAQPATGYPTYRRNNTYVNPNYKPANKYVRPPPSIPKPSVRPVPPPTTEVKDVVLGGVAFESSGRSLVRKDLAKPASSGPSNQQAPHSHQFTRKSGHLVPTSRVYKPRSTRGRRGGRPTNRNMTLNNSKRPYQSRLDAKRLKYLNKPCPRFTTTGACSRGLTCMYQHDPTKIAICWNFLQGNCPNTADSCNLSHDPTPERTPLCLHFLNRGRCTRENCPFPHVNVGARHGICRDFAVLGYCEKGLDCDKQHVRECPDFAEKGTCSTKGCKLPHVIRANRTRKPVAATNATSTPITATYESVLSSLRSKADSSDVSAGGQVVTADSGQIGDEYISLTFNESESSEDESDDDEGDDNEDDESQEEAEEELGEEGGDPNVGDGDELMVHP